MRTVFDPRRKPARGPAIWGAALFFTGLALVATLLLLTKGLGVHFPFPLSLIWIAASALVALGLARLYARASFAHEAQNKDDTP